MGKLRIGETFLFRPAGLPQGRTVTGTVIYINRAHRFFTVLYELNGSIFRESFKY
mgnify:FL=1